MSDAHGLEVQVGPYAMNSDCDVPIILLSHPNDEFKFKIVDFDHVVFVCAHDDGRLKDFFSLNSAVLYVWYDSRRMLMTEATLKKYFHQIL